MEWAYVAGLFDGEGSITLYAFTSGLGVGGIRLRTTITSNYTPTWQALQHFLSKEGIDSLISHTRNGFGEQSHLQIGKWEHCAKFLNNVQPYSIEKHRHIQIALKAISLHVKCKREGRGAILTHSKEFDVLRHELHALANKGPKMLKTWPAQHSNRSATVGVA